MLSWIYGIIIRTRNSLYEKGILESFSLGVPVISIGNITVGGTGKTPLVAFVAELLYKNGEKVCVLSRGYGRINSRKRILVADGEKVLVDAKQAGDEPFELAVRLLGKAIVVADANRIAAGNWAREKFGITVFVLDDAFQHRRVRRDLDIVTVDATNPFGNEKLLPTGVLREPLENLSRASAIVITRANLCEEKHITDLKFEISKINEHCRIFVSGNRISNLIDLGDFSANAQSTQTAKDKEQRTKDKALAFCALGNPENFFEQLRRENFNLAATQKFPDHYFYKQTDIEKLEKIARQKGAEILLTTAKDAVKLKDLNFNLPCFVVESDLVFDDEDTFRKFLSEIYKLANG
ncbi:MAG: tetraacyldisaccharide 4'-kinase [Acidobacteria bacterium]|nr:tetraacyldisaccharide 4'-kinase [Acidobacteriota bacterium]MCA1639912.1 tetraacyldisaccharide 4'-kinase [Acidobacteriota bacterium]